MAPPHFYQLMTRQVEKSVTSKNKDTMYLTEKQTSYVYKKVEQGNIIKTETMKHEIEQEKLMEIDREDENPYKKVVLNKVYKEEDKMMQMESCSILSNNVRYVHHDKKPKIPHKLDLNTLDYCQHKEIYCKLKEERSKM